MKKIIVKLLLVLVLIAGSHQLISQPPPPPGEHGEPGNQNAGNAPIDGGLGVLLTLGAAYGGKKVYDLHEETKYGE